MGVVECAIVKKFSVLARANKSTAIGRSVQIQFMVIIRGNVLNASAFVDANRKLRRYIFMFFYNSNLIVIDN